MVNEPVNPTELCVARVSFLLRNIWYSVLNSNCMCEQMLFTLNFGMFIAISCVIKHNVQNSKNYIIFKQLNELENLFFAFRL